MPNVNVWLWVTRDAGIEGTRNRDRFAGLPEPEVEVALTEPILLGGWSTITITEELRVLTIPSGLLSLEIGNLF